jgi:hypothetical protein
MLPRDATWLNQQLDLIWSAHFPDVARLNTVTIKWSRVNRTRLGTITGKGGTFWKNNPEVSEIRINPLLQHESVPISVVWQTIAHELSHYTHGFCSPHPQKYPHPHRGNVIQKELQARDLGVIHTEAEGWLKQHWRSHVIAHAAPSATLKRRRYVPRNQMSVLSHLKRALKRRYRS